MTAITSKPDPGSVGTAANGVISEILQVFLDDLELKLNTDLFGIGLQLPSYAVADLPPAGTTNIETGMIAYARDEAGGAVPVFFDGSDWRRVTDRVVAS